MIYFIIWYLIGLAANWMLFMSFCKELEDFFDDRLFSKNLTWKGHIIALVAFSPITSLLGIFLFIIYYKLFNRKLPLVFWHKFY